MKPLEIVDAVLIGVKFAVALVEGARQGMAPEVALRRAISVLPMIAQVDDDVDAAARGRHAEARRRAEEISEK